ncbi:MAG TPA: response regulator [Steroidobacteraceae bacterium]
MPRAKTVPAKATPIVYIVDDDISVREALEALIVEAGWRARVFASAEAFLAHARALVPGCLVLDVGLPDLNGLDLQKQIAAGDELPIIFITGRGDIPMTVEAMKAGAVEFLTKPFVTETLLCAIRGALERSSNTLADGANLRTLRSRHAALSRREQEVMALVVLGRLNKQVALALRISEVTVKGHRGRMMRKMCARSVPELVNMADQLGLQTAGKK